MFQLVSRFVYQWLFTFAMCMLGLIRSFICGDVESSIIFVCKVSVMHFIH
uniref:Uncharacterized protein n=1 Tax=Rhizophora mucronata TaxID=61149 RepID=A0A2P2J4U0_RHIMU